MSADRLANKLAPTEGAVGEVEHPCRSELVREAFCMAADRLANKLAPTEGAVGEVEHPCRSELVREAFLHASRSSRQQVGSYRRRSRSPSAATRISL